MLLVVDIGNTNLTFGVYREQAFSGSFRAETRAGATRDEIAAFVHQSLSLRGFDPAGIRGTAVASVVPPLTPIVTEAINLCCTKQSCAPLLIGPESDTGITIRYARPEEVGADRIVNAVAAFAKIGAGVIVVDFGTATTFDCVSPHAEYLGGVIAPGLEVSLSALLGRAAKLQPIELALPERVVGKSTTHAIQSGAIFGHAALVDGLVERLRGELGFPCKVLGTGGLASTLAQFTRCIDSVEPELTLEGLRLLFERHAR